MNYYKHTSFFIMALAASLIISSCNKNNDNTTPATAVTDDEAAEAVTESVSSTSGGLVLETENMASITTISTAFMSCGQSSDTVISGASLSGAIISYSYNATLNRTLTCNRGIPSQFNFTYAGNNNYTAPHMSSADSSHAQLTITDIQPSYSSYIFNGSYVRKGTQQSSIKQQRSISSTITFTGSDITVNKATMKIVSGTVAVQFAGVASGGANTTIGGTLTFLGNSQATLVFNDGKSYPIQW